MARKSKNTQKEESLSQEINALMTPESRKDMTLLTPAIQQFLIRYLDLRDSVITSQLAEVIAPINKILSSIELGLNDVKQDMREIKIKVNTVESNQIELEEKMHIIERKFKLRWIVAIGLSVIISVIIVYLLLPWFHVHVLHHGCISLLFK